MPTRDELDEIAWRTLDAIAPRPRPTERHLGQVRNYVEMWDRTESTGDREGAWSALLHGFFVHPDAETFAYPPPPGFGLE